MADPTLKKTTIQFGYTASDGYRMSFAAKGGTGSKHLVTGEEVPPEEALLAGLAELSRILTLFGMEVEAQRVFGEARQAVHEWRAHLTPKAGVDVPQGCTCQDGGSGWCAACSSGAGACPLGCTATENCAAIRDGCGSECVAKPFQLRTDGVRASDRGVIE